MFKLNVPFLRQGKGNKPSDGGCIMQVVDWLDTGGWSDHPTCVLPMIRDASISINDYVDDEHRQRLLGLTSRLMNTNTPGVKSYKIERELREWWNPRATEFNNWAARNAYHASHAERSERLFGLLLGLLDEYDRLVGREKVEEQEIDFSELCALMNA